MEHYTSFKVAYSHARPFFEPGIFQQYLRNSCLSKFGSGKSLSDVGFAVKACQSGEAMAIGGKRPHIDSLSDFP